MSEYEVYSPCIQLISSSQLITNNFLFALFPEPTQPPRDLKKVSDNGTCASLMWKAPQLSKEGDQVFPAQVSLRPLLRPFSSSGYAQPYRRAHAPSKTLYHKDGDFGTVFVMERSCAVPLLNVDCHLSDRFCTTLRRRVNRYSDLSGSKWVGARTGIY